MHDDHPKGRLGSQNNRISTTSKNKPTSRAGDDDALRYITFTVAIRRVETIADLLKNRIPFPRCREVANG